METQWGKWSIQIKMWFALGQINPRRRASFSFLKMMPVHCNVSEVIFTVIIYNIHYKRKSTRWRKATLLCVALHCDLVLGTDEQLHMLRNLDFVTGKTDKSQKFKSCSQNLNSNTDRSASATAHDVTCLSSLLSTRRPGCHLGFLFYFIVVHTTEARSIWFTKHNSPLQMKLVFLAWHSICQSRTYARVRVSCRW